VLEAWSVQFALPGQGDGAIRLFRATCSHAACLILGAGRSQLQYAWLTSWAVSWTLSDCLPFLLI
jgi:hypothetical protein